MAMGSNSYEWLEMSMLEVLMKIDKALLMEMYRVMVLSRAFELRLRELYLQKESTSMTPYLYS